MTGKQGGNDVQEVARRTNWTIVSLVAGAIFLVLVTLFVIRTGDPDQDKLTNAELQAAAPPPSLEKLCSNSITYNLIKRAIFERAAQLRGTDESFFTKLAGYAVVRMDNPVMESQDNSTGALNCSGSVSIDLPPGVTASGNRTLTANVDYAVNGGANGHPPTVELHNADAIITPLATLAAVSPGPNQPAGVSANASDPEANAVALEPTAPAPHLPAAPPAPPIRAAPPSQLRSGNVRSSLNCARAGDPNAVAICSDADIAALDRQMASAYSRALTLASPDQQDLLRDTNRRFADFRDSCGTRTCLQNAYKGRIREIRDIMEGSWQPH